MSSASAAEMEAAFALDAHDDQDDDLEMSGNEHAGLLRNRTTTDSVYAWEGEGNDDHRQTPGGYDFERDRDYDRPPPGDPPAPSQFAEPNNWGNSNGLLPQPVVHSAPKFPWWRKLVPSGNGGDYTPVAQTSVNAGRIVGGGTQNDGVFSNVAAKPSSHTTPVLNADGNIHLVPEDSISHKESPPSYADAQLDQAPSYNSVTTTVVVPDGDSGAGVEETGGVATFAMYALISFFFQFVGFVMTHMMAVNVAGRCGSRAGLGVSLIQFGLYLRSDGSEDNAAGGASTPLFDGVGGDAGSGSGTITETTEGNTVPSYPPAETIDPVALSPAAREWLSFFFMTTGWFVLLHASIGFWRAKRWERVISQATQSDSDSSAPGTVSRAEYERDVEVRRNLGRVFGLSLDDLPQPHPQGIVDANGYVVVVPDRTTLEEARLTRDLRAAGLI